MGGESQKLEVFFGIKGRLESNGLFGLSSGIESSMRGAHTLIIERHGCLTIVVMMQR